MKNNDEENGNDDRNGDFHGDGKNELDGFLQDGEQMKYNGNIVH